jgi:hypothetical protein
LLVILIVPSQESEIRRRVNEDAALSTQDHYALMIALQSQQCLVFVARYSAGNV